MKKLKKELPRRIERLGIFCEERNRPVGDLLSPRAPRARRIPPRPTPPCRHHRPKAAYGSPTATICHQHCSFHVVNPLDVQSAP